MEGYEPSTYGDRFADVYDDWYGHVTDADACTARLASLVGEAGGGPVLELGVGSGRLALPLAARGVEVHGVDASERMLDLLRAKPSASLVRAVRADMSHLPADGIRYAVVFVAFNTFFNLPTEEDQLRCMRGVAARLRPLGRFVLEAFVPRDPKDVAGAGSVVPRRISADEVVLAVTTVDPRAQTISGSHVHLRDTGMTLRPWHLRYATPDQLDDLAERAGLVLDWRCAGWSGEPFDGDSDLHVSAYRLGADG